MIFARRRCRVKSEWVSHSKVEGEITAEVWMNDGIAMLSTGIDGIDGLHTTIETEDEEVEVEADAKTIGEGNLLIELIKLKLTTRLAGIVANGPDIAGIHENGTLDLPEQLAAELHAGIELDIACLIEEVTIAWERTWAQITH